MSALAVLGTLVSWIVNQAHNRKVAAAAERAESRAERSAVAAERSAAAQELVAQAFSDFLSRQERAEDGADAPRATVSAEPSDIPSDRSDQVRWTVDRHKDSRYTLTILRGTARNVRLRADNAVRFDGPDGPIAEMTEGDTTTVVVTGSWQTGTPELVVSWKNQDGTEQEWRRVIP